MFITLIVMIFTFHGAVIEIKPNGHSPQIGLLYIIKRKAAIHLTFDLCCKPIAALFFVPYILLSYLRILPANVDIKFMPVRFNPSCNLD